jgi:formylglycine-generating enzyme required for sulfatase activity
MWWLALALTLSMLPAASFAHAGCHGVEAQVGSDMRCLKPKDTFRDCAECPEMVMVPAGSFIMGSPMSEEARLDNEEPRRMVIIARPFAVGRFEVTFAEWDACVVAGDCLHRPDDAGWGRGRRPVINVSWNDITNAYLPWLSRKTDKTYRLLTEAEWEYAARAGSQTKYAWGDEIGKNVCNGCGSQWDYKQTAPVGSFQANAFGLHDMHGNVWEWVADCYTDSYANASSDGEAVPEVAGCERVLRGGAGYDVTGYFAPESLRSAKRRSDAPQKVFKDSGFRLARTLDP